jgi:hypothetical protein
MPAGRAPRVRAASHRRAAGGLLGVLLALSTPCSAQARSTVSALPVQGLRWGALAAGIPVPVSPRDAAGRATVELVGSGQVTVTFTLPAALAGEAGASLPLRFGPGDGMVVLPRSTSVIEFDPGEPVTFRIPPDAGGAQIFLGGTALPGPRQPPGSYTGTITVHVQVASTAT